MLFSASFKGFSLFMNSLHIIDADEGNDIPIENLANNIAVALGTNVTRIFGTEAQLATTVAQKTGKFDQLLQDIQQGCDIDKWLYSYTNDDVWATVQRLTAPLSDKEIDLVIEIFLKHDKDLPSSS